VSFPDYAFVLQIALFSGTFFLFCGFAKPRSTDLVHTPAVHWSDNVAMSRDDVELHKSAQINGERYRRSVAITINLDSVRRNLATARRLSGGSRQFATIKADAYGHGAVAIAQALSPPKWQLENIDCMEAKAEPVDGTADGFAVVTVDEALELRKAGIELPILVLQGPQNSDACSIMHQYRLWPVIHDLHQYDWFRMSPERNLLNAWLKVDSGMGRLGVQPVEATQILNNSDDIRWVGLMTHFACADEVDNPFTDHQLAAFNSVATERLLDRSLANSAAVLAWPQTQADWARPGIMLYGCNPLDRALPEGVSLTPAMRVQAPIMSVKNLPAGSGIGYAQSYVCPQDMPVAYVALGYRDGLPRVLDNSAAVWVEGLSCPIIGRVSMDSIAVDVRRSPNASIGMFVEFWGQSGSIDALARAAGTINYELLTSIRGWRDYITDE
jgi:alanine racemase